MANGAVPESLNFKPVLTIFISTYTVDNMAEREPYLYQFDDIFWLTVSGSLFAFLAVAIKACLKSNCTKIKFLGFECTREPTEGEPDTEDLELQLPPIPSRTPVRR